MATENRQRVEGRGADVAADLLAALALLALAVFVIVEATRMPPRGPLGFISGPALLPLLLGAVLFVLSGALCVHALRQGALRALPEWVGSLLVPESTRLAVVVVLLGLMVLLIGRVPFWLANLIYYTLTFAYLRIGGGRTVLVLLYAGLLAFAIGYLLPLAFELPMP
jgi:hypothetical protein